MPVGFRSPLDPSLDSNLISKELAASVCCHLNGVNNLKIGSPAWIRTTTHGSKGRCPTVRRPGNLQAKRQPSSVYQPARLDRYRRPGLRDCNHLVKSAPWDL